MRARPLLAAEADPPHQQLYFDLATQRFVEMVREPARYDVLALLEYANQEFAPMVRRYPRLAPAMEEVMTLLVLEDPTKSPLLGKARRTHAANRVNAALFARRYPGAARSKLATLCSVTAWADGALIPDERAELRLPPAFFQ